VIETPNSDVDVDQLMDQLRRELAAGGSSPAPRLVHHPSAPPLADLRWLEFLNAAERHAAVGAEVPAFNRYGPIKRQLARLVARPILFMAELVTHPQRTFNTTTLEALRALGDRVQSLEQELAVWRAGDTAPPESEAATADPEG
jgi:hypothetical protein